MSLTRLASPRLLSLGTALTLGLATTSLASAQSLEEEQQAEAAATATPTSAADAPVTDEQNHELTDDQAVLEERVGVERVDELDPTERPDTDYFFFGAVARGVVVPEFITDLFVQTESGLGSSGTPINMGVGAYFNYRRNGFNITAEAWYLGFGTRAYYHGLGAADSEYEYIESNLGVVFGSFLFGWSFDITNWFAIDLGFGIGVGGMVGDMHRTEAHRGGDRSGQLRPCSGPNDSADGLGYCESGVELRDSNGRVTSTTSEGGTYQRAGGPGNGPNPFYFGDGGVPPIFAWLDLPRVGIRIKPIHQVQIRIDGGYNLYGFNFGGSIGYGF